MNLIDQAKADIEQITSNLNEFAVEIIFTSPTEQTATISGLHTKIHLGVDTDGLAVNSKKSHISFSEKFLIDASYPVRNSSGEVNLRNHRVAVKDSPGNLKNYTVKEIFPDETIGLITCMLDDFE